MYRSSSIAVLFSICAANTANAQLTNNGEEMNRRVLFALSTAKSGIVGSTPSDTPGGIFVIFKPEATFPMIMAGLSAGKVTFAFAKKPRGVDIPIDIDTRVETMKDNEPVLSMKTNDDFIACTKELLKSTK